MNKTQHAAQYGYRLLTPYRLHLTALKVKTGLVQANFESSVLKSSGNPKVITNIHANVSEGFVGGIFGGTTSYATANGGFVLYPNKSNTNQMASVYAK